MKDFNWSEFTRKVAIKAPMDKLYKAWTTSAGIETWFLSKAVFLDENQQALAPDTPYHAGCRYDWTWFLYAETEQGRIEEANGTDRIAFSFAGDCLVTITLQQQDEYVLVTLTQSQIPDTDEARQHIRLGCATGWSFYLVNLKSVYEGGLDLRNKDTRLQPMVNN